MNLIQQWLIAIVFDEYCVCRQWSCLFKCSVILLHFRLKWQFCLLASGNMFSAELMVFVFSSSGLNRTDDRTSKSVKKHADHSDKQSELKDYCYFESILSTSASCLYQCYQWVQLAAISQRSKKLTCKEVCKIKQLIKMLNNMHENSVWGSLLRPVSSSNRTEKRHQQDHCKIAQNCESNLPPQDNRFILLHTRIHFKIIKHCLICELMM